jgi:hypothetical protein
MKKLYQALFATLVIAVLMTATSLTVLAAPRAAIGAEQNDNRLFRAALRGFQETPLTLFSGGSGTFTATLSDDGTSLTYTLSYAGLTGAFAAHIHLGAPGTTGGVSAFLCGGGGKPTCPTSSGTVTGTITAADVIGPAGQGLAVGNFAGLLASMRAGATYANVHTPAHPGGEIRGAITSDEE